MNARSPLPQWMMSLFVLLPLLPAQARAQRDGRPKVAVMPLVDKSRTLPRALVDGLADALRTQLAQSGRFIVIDKTRQAATLKELMHEEKKQSYKECFDASCQIPLGKALAADSILRSQLVRVGSNYLLNLEQVDLAKEAVVSAAQARAAIEPRTGRDDRLLGAVSSAVRRLSRTSVRGPYLIGTLGRRAPTRASPEELARRRRAQEERHKKIEQQRAERRRLRAAADERRRLYSARRKRLRSRINHLMWGATAMVCGSALGIASAWVLTSKINDAEEAAAQAETPAALERARDDVTKHRTTGIVLGAMGAAALGGGLYLLLSMPSAEAPPVTTGSLELDRLPTGGPLADGGFALSWGGRF